MIPIPRTKRAILPSDDGRVKRPTPHEYALTIDESDSADHKRGWRLYVHYFRCMVSKRGKLRPWGNTYVRVRNGVSGAR